MKKPDYDNLDLTNLSLSYKEKIRHAWEVYESILNEYLKSGVIFMFLDLKLDDRKCFIGWLKNMKKEKDLNIINHFEKCLHNYK